MPGRLTTHVLDTAHGCPAAGVAIQLWRLSDDEADRQLLCEMTTNAHGRTDAPLIEGDDLTTGIYELIFRLGDYFRATTSADSAPRFLDTVPVRFGVTDSTAHYHVPLLASPWAYSTYRGS